MRYGRKLVNLTLVVLCICVIVLGWFIYRIITNL